MSTDSFKRYQEEMAQNVAQEAAAAAAKKNPLHRSRRASVGTERDLHNERWCNFSSPEMRRSSRGYHPKTMHRAQKSLSLDDGLDNLVQSFISSFHDGDEQRNRTSAHLIQSKLSKSDGQMIDKEASPSGVKESGLSSEELKVLTNMMRRLSNSERSDGYSDQEDLCDGEIPSSDLWYHLELKTALKSETSTVQMHDKASVQKNVDPISFSSDAFDTCPKLERGETASSMWTCRSNLSSSDRNEHSEGAKMHMGESLDTRDHLCMPVLGREQSSGAVVCETEDIVRSLECNDSISSNSAEDQNPTTDMPSFNRLHSSGTAGAVVCETDDFVRMDTPLDTRDHLCMRILGTEKSSASSIRAEFKSSPAQSRMLSDAAVVEECNDSTSSNSSDDQNPTIGMPSFNRLTSSGTAGAVVCETDDFVRTMRDFDDEVQKQRQRINSNLSGSTMSQTRCTSPPRRPSSSTLLSADMIDLDGPPLKQDCGDLLAEGIEHLSMAMLVSIYGKLREMSLLGHVSVKLRDIDVNSHQYNSRKNEMKRLGEWTAADEAKGYLDSTRNAGFIVRCVMDEAELFEAEHARGAGNEFSHALLEYDAR